MKFGDDPGLTREKIGYSEYTNSKLITADLLLDDNGIIDMNITTPSLGSILNEQRVVKIDGNIYEYGMHEIKNIESGEKIPVMRTSTVVDQKIRKTATIFADGSCSNSNGNYKVIGYEEEINYGDGCLSYWQRHIKIRSLKKILGTWQNYNTNFMSVTADVKIIEWYVSSSGLPSYVSRTFVDKTNFTYNMSFGNTGYWVFIDRVPFNCLPALPTGYTARAIKFYKRFYTINGYNSTTCSFGQNPFEYCEAGPCNLINN